MNMFENLRMAFSSIAANKLRSLLTMLGIIIGISAVITITTLGTTLRATIKNTLNSLGSNLMVVYIQQKNVDNYYDTVDVDMTDNDLISMEMVDEFLEKYPDEFQMANENPFKSATIVNSRNTTVKMNLVGGYEGTLAFNSYKLLSGRNISTSDIKGKKHTCVVSDIFVEQYFKEKEEPLGYALNVTLDDGMVQEFTIVGVYKYNSLNNGMGDRSKMSTPVYIPDTVVNNLKGIYTEQGYYNVYFAYNTKYDANDMKAHLTDFFEEKYKPNKNFGTEVVSMEDQLKTIDMVINIVTLVITVIAAISLIVGGVGVMNIMLVSVTERTREIGIRKALGAKKSLIKKQFVMEAVIICLIGGVIGIVIGILNGELAGLIADHFVASSPEYAEILGEITVVPSLSAIVVSIIFSTLTGVFFGIYPAGKAAKMNPIDALRYD